MEEELKRDVEEELPAERRNEIERLGAEEIKYEEKFRRWLFGGVTGLALMAGACLCYYHSPNKDNNIGFYLALTGTALAGLSAINSVRALINRDSYESKRIRLEDGF
jgi:hypothetical protein